MRNRIPSPILAALAGVALSTGAAAQPEGHPPVPTEQQSLSSKTDDVIKRMLMEGARGSLAVTVVQGTRSGPPVGELDLRVDLYHRNDPIYEMHAGTDAGGVAMIGDLPVALEVRPVVRVEYGGVSYLEIGPMMSAASPDAVVKLTVYETTDEAPAWYVAARHVTATRLPEGTLVEETLVVENPADQTWLGGEPEAEEKRTAVRVSLPEAAQEVELLAGFHGWCCTKREGRELAVQMPLMPGQSTFRYTYVLPGSAAELDLRFGAPAPTRSVVLFVPDDGTEATPASLALAGTEVVGGARMRIYQGTQIGAGAETGLVLAALRNPEPASASAPGVSAKTVAVAAGGLAALLGIGFAVLRAKKHA